jgi:transcriptional regulator with XRE-family HTH domain
MNEDSSISLRIKRIITELYEGNQSEFARRIGISESNVRSYLVGTTPKADVLEKIVNNIAISYEWLLTGEGAMLRNEQTSSQSTYQIIETEQHTGESSTFRDEEAATYKIKIENDIYRELYEKEHEKNTELYIKIGNFEEKLGAKVDELFKRIEFLEKELAENKKRSDKPPYPPQKTAK